MHDVETIAGERLNLFAPPTDDLFSAEAVTKVMNLQNEVPKITGRLRRAVHLDRYVNSKKAFIDNLPKVMITPDASNFEDRH